MRRKKKPETEIADQINQNISVS